MPAMSADEPQLFSADGLRESLSACRQLFCDLQERRPEHESVLGSLLRTACEMLPSFASKTAHMRYLPKGALPSEMLALAEAVRLFNATHYIESGTAHGQSTETMARFAAGTSLRIISIDNNRLYGLYNVTLARLAKYSNVRLVLDDSTRLLPRLLRGLPSHSRAIVMVDGPKATAGLTLAMQALIGHARVVPAVALHDVLPRGVAPTFNYGDLTEKLHTNWTAGGVHWLQSTTMTELLTYAPPWRPLFAPLDWHALNCSAPCNATSAQRFGSGLWLAVGSHAPAAAVDWAERPSFCGYNEHPRSEVLGGARRGATHHSMLAHTSHAAVQPTVAVIVAGEPRTFGQRNLYLPLSRNVNQLGPGAHAFVLLKVKVPLDEALLSSLEPALEALNAAWGSPFVEVAQQAEDVYNGRCALKFGRSYPLSQVLGQLTSWWRGLAMVERFEHAIGGRQFQHIAKVRTDGLWLGAFPAQPGSRDGWWSDFVPSLRETGALPERPPDQAFLLPRHVAAAVLGMARAYEACRGPMHAGLDEEAWTYSTARRAAASYNSTIARVHLPLLPIAALTSAQQRLALRSSARDLKRSNLTVDEALAKKQLVWCDQFFTGPRAACLAIAGGKSDAQSGDPAAAATAPPQAGPEGDAGGDGGPRSPRVALCVAGAMRVMVPAGIHLALRRHVVDALGVPVDTYFAVDVNDTEHSARTGATTASSSDIEAALSALAPVVGVRVGVQRLSATAATLCSGEERACVADDSSQGVAAADPARRKGCYAPQCEACDARKYAPLARRRSACYSMLEGHEAKLGQRYAAVIVTRPDMSVPAPLPPFRDWSPEMRGADGTAYVWTSKKRCCTVITDQSALLTRAAAAAYMRGAAAFFEGTCMRRASVPMLDPRMLWATPEQLLTFFLLAEGAKLRLLPPTWNWGSLVRRAPEAVGASVATPRRLTPHLTPVATPCREHEEKMTLLCNLQTAAKTVEVRLASPHLAGRAACGATGAPLLNGISLVVQYFRHIANVAPLLANAAAAGVDEVLINDDSHDVVWAEAVRQLPVARRPMRLHVSLSPNVHEVRAYNTLARVASGRFFAFAQDDNLMEDSTWAAKAVALFDAYPSLGLIAGVPSGWLPKCKWACALNMTGAPQMGASVDRLRCPITGTLGFFFVARATLYTFFVRRTAFEALGGFNQQLSPCPGQPAIMLDDELVLRMWRHGWQVAALQLGMRTGVGGHGTRRSANTLHQLSERKAANLVLVQKLATPSFVARLNAQVEGLNTCLLEGQHESSGRGAANYRTCIEKVWSDGQIA